MHALFSLNKLENNIGVSAAYRESKHKPILKPIKKTKVHQSLVVVVPYNCSYLPINKEKRKRIIKIRKAETPILSSLNSLSLKTTMVAVAFSNSLLFNASTTSPPSTRLNLLSPSKLSLPNSGSQSVFTHLKKKKDTLSSNFVVYSSSDCGDDSTKETPIELSNHFFFPFSVIGFALILILVFFFFLFY